MKRIILFFLFFTLFVRTSSFGCDGLVPVVSSNSYIGNGQYILTIEFCEEVSNGDFLNGNMLSNANIFGLIFTVNGANIIGILTPSLTGVTSGVTVFPTQLAPNQVEYGDWGNPAAPVLLEYGDPQECWTVQFVVDGPATSVSVGGSTYVGAAQPGAGMVNTGGIWVCTEVITIPPVTCNSSWTPPVLCVGSTTPIDLDATTVYTGVFSGPGVNSATGIYTPTGLPGPVSVTFTVGDAFLNCSTTQNITPVSLTPPTLTDQTVCPGTPVNLDATVTIAGGCTYTLVLTDSWGDGWNGADVDIYINGVAYLMNQSVANCGSGPCTNTISIPVNSGDIILFNYTGGTFDNENTITLYNSNMTQVNTINNPPNGNLGAGITANCPSGALVYSWSPAAGLSNPNIANPVATPAVTTTYTVTITSAALGCSTSTPVTITVTPSITPTFNAVAPICSGAVLAALPTTSTNGINGTWSPALNNMATTTYTFTPAAGQCASTTTLTISVGPPATPTFVAVAPICVGDVLSPLPTISTNGISGSWSPALNNMATTLYTFTPTAGQCASTTTLTISVGPPATPTFTAVAPICSGTALAALPTTSNNGINGTWSPAINNTATTLYTFTPTAGQCATTTTLTISVNPSITPTFAAVAPICSGAVLAALPTTSTNGISGTWSPAINNIATTLYTFTPTVGQCATTTTLTITVNPSVTPTFAVVAPICVGDVLSPLPTISTNGISGSWSPALNNMATTLYTFTPTAGQCASTTTLTISVGPPATPTFTAVAPICSGTALAALPTTSNNGINGTWSPAINNTATTLYTFTPTAGQCATTTTLTISVNPSITPTFAAVAPICSGAVLAALPTTSTNGISGTWSPAINNIATTLYTFTPTVGQCATTTTLTITVNPISQQSQDITLCTGSDYTYPDGTTSTNILVNETHISQLTNVFGCDSIIVTDVAIEPAPPANAGSDISICVGEFVTLDANDVQGNTVIWSGGVIDGVPFAPVSTQTYTLTVTNNTGCQSTDAVTVTLNPIPVVSFIGDDLSGCEPHTVTFTNTSVGGPFDNCTWNFGNGNTAVGCGPITYTYNQAGLYTVSLSVTNFSGCSASVQFVDYIEVFPQPNAAFTASQLELDILNTEVSFNNNSSNSDYYTWDFGDQSAISNVVNPTHNYPEEIGGYIITLIAYSNAGCSDTSTLFIPVNDILIYYIPNTFTPDGDAYNQFFQPVFTSGYDPYDFNLFIYNRWGEIIWESHDASVGWDGLYGGKLVQDGTYTWKIDFKTTMSDERIMNVGHVNVIR